MARGMSWTAEANAKLFIGILAQLKAANMKLDYKVLAEHMGPECTPVAAKLQIQKLRREAGGTATADKNEGAAESADAATPATTPVKRKAGAAGGAKGAAKKPQKEVKKEIKKEVKNEATVDEDGEEKSRAGIMEAE